jgi:hypothetical protein
MKRSSQAQMTLTSFENMDPLPEAPRSTRRASASDSVAAGCYFAASPVMLPLSSLQLSDPNSIAASCDVPAVPGDVTCWPVGSPCKVLLTIFPLDHASQA